MEPGAEFERALGAAVRARVAPGAITVIVAWPEPEETALAVLGAVVRALERHGVARGRQILLLPEIVESAPAGEDRARAFAARLGITGLAHQGSRAACFVAGRTRAGTAIEWNDELREAEAIVFAGDAALGADDQTPAETLARAVLSARSRRALAREGSAAGGVLAQLGPGIGVTWDARGAAVVRDLP